MVLYSFHLFAGGGGGILADQLLGHRVIGAVEIEAYPRRILLARQLDGILLRFPIWDDVTTFRYDNPECTNYIERLRGIADNLIICGGFPCQDISAAGKGAGITGQRSGLWKEFARIVGEVRPAYVFVENSPMLVVRGLGTVLGDLASIGYDAQWDRLSAAYVGANHLRKRIWIFAFDTHNGYAYRGRFGCGQSKNIIQRAISKNNKERHRWQHELGAIDAAERFSSYTDALRILHGIPDRMDRLAALGNAQVPIVAATAFTQLTNSYNL